MLTNKSDLMEGNAQYQLLYHRLKREILSDVYPIGSILPSENELCASANLSRSTVRQALGQLEAEGYILKHKGKGSIVKSKNRTLNLLSFQGFSAMVDPAKISTLSVQEPVLMPWPQNFYFELTEMEQMAGAIYFARVRSVEGRPLMYELTFIPQLNLPRFTQYFKSDHSLFAFLAKHYQVEITGMEQQVWAVKADVELVQYLNVEINSPLLKISRKYFSNRPYLHLYSLLYCNTEKYALGNSSGSINSNL